MFHPSRLQEVEDRIDNDLSCAMDFGSVKLYLCWYDEYLVDKENWKGVYPCSDKRVCPHEVMAIIKNLMLRPFIIRHNCYFSAYPVGISDIAERQRDEERYIEVCLVQ